MTPPGRPQLRRAIIAIPFVAAILLAMRLDRGPSRATADAAHPGFTLRDESAAAGIHFVHHRPTFDPKIAGIEPHVAAVGASVSVTDFDGDGWPDVYFTNSKFGEPNALYRNRGDGTFEDVAASAGLADLNEPGAGVSMGAIWGDIDNDGREDVLVYRYGKLALFRNTDGKHFADITEAAGLKRWVNSNGAIWLDYDRDGLLDLYVTAYFRGDIDLWHLATTRVMHNSFEFATNGGKNLLFHNLGRGKFEEVTDRYGVGSTRWSLAAASADFNDDGWPDIYLANDYGPEELYLNDHGKRFVLTTAGLESESKSGMAVALGDAFNRGRLDAFVTNISERGYIFQNNNLRLNALADAGRFRNVAEGAIAIPIPPGRKKTIWPLPAGGGGISTGPSKTVSPAIAGAYTVVRAIAAIADRSLFTLSLPVVDPDSVSMPAPLRPPKASKAPPSWRSRSSLAGRRPRRPRSESRASRSARDWPRCAPSCRNA